MDGKTGPPCQGLKKAAIGREGWGQLLRQLPTHATAASSGFLPLGICSCSALCLECP